MKIVFRGCGPAVALVVLRQIGFPKKLIGRFIAAYVLAAQFLDQPVLMRAMIALHSAPHGFLAQGTKFTSIDYPGLVGTTAWGINSAGQMVGNWFDTDGNSHGWVATPGDKGKPQ